MPLRRNECATCGLEFRTLESHGDIEGALCPSCGSRQTRRLLPHVGVQFRGSGFYRTDHGRCRGAEPTQSDETKTAEAHSPGEDQPSTVRDAAAAGPRGA